MWVVLGFLDVQPIIPSRYLILWALMVFPTYGYALLTMGDNTQHVNWKDRVKEALANIPRPYANVLGTLLVIIIAALFLVDRIGEPSRENDPTPVFLGISLFYVVSIALVVGSEAAYRRQHPE